MSIGKRRTFTEALQGMDPGLKHNSGNMAATGSKTGTGKGDNNNRLTSSLKKHRKATFIQASVILEDRVLVGLLLLKHNVGRGFLGCKTKQKTALSTECSFDHSNAFFTHASGFPPSSLNLSAASDALSVRSFITLSILASFFKKKGRMIRV